ncbi:MAG: hypothetical protein ABWY82_22715 [Tardiphaga sp.]
MFDLARFHERAVCIPERSLGITEQPRGHRTKSEARYPQVLAKSRHQSPVLVGAVKSEGFVVVRFGINEVPDQRQRTPHGAVSDHPGYRSPVLLAKGEEPRREPLRNVAIEVDEIDDPLAEKRGEQQRRIVGSLSEPFRLLDQRSHLSDGSFRFGRAISLDMHERVQERDM